MDGADEVVAGQNDFVAAETQQFAGHFELVGLETRAADVLALGLHERVAHGAADQHLVHDGQQTLDEADLVGHFAAAEQTEQRPRRVGQQLAEDGQFLGHQHADHAGLALHGGGHCDHRGVAARWQVPKASLT